MPDTIKQFEAALTLRIAEIAYAVALPAVARASRQLAQALDKRIIGPGRIKLHLPQHWAKYLNDGHGLILPRGGRVLVWFRNPADDPRLNQGISPAFSEVVKHLTPQEFYDGLARNRESPEDPPMIIAAYSGPTIGKRFFDNNFGMAPLVQIVNQEMPRFMKQHVEDYLGDLLHVRVTDTFSID